LWCTDLLLTIQAQEILLSFNEILCRLGEPVTLTQVFAMIENWGA
jgi:hypothetical protein